MRSAQQSTAVLYSYEEALGDCCGYPLPYIDTMTLPSTGTYTIMLSASSTNTGSVTMATSTNYDM